MKKYTAHDVVTTIAIGVILCTVAAIAVILGIGFVALAIEIYSQGLIPSLIYAWVIILLLSFYWIMHDING